MERILIVIVNWNTGELLAQCLRSLAGLPEVELIDEIIVVDNDSRDRSVALAKAVVSETGNRPRVRFIQHERNVGFAAANNSALERVRQRGEVPHVMLLNPDTEVQAGALSGLLSVLEAKPEAGIAGPKLLNTDGSLQTSVRDFPTWQALVLYMLKLGRLVPAAAIDYGKEQQVDQVMGAAFLIRNEALEAVGNLDEKFFLWFEEVDYCQRALAAGWQSIYTPRAQVVHHGGASFHQLIGFNKTVPWLRSVLRYAKKHANGPVVGLLLVLVPLNLLLTLPAAAAHIALRRKTISI